MKLELITPTSKETVPVNWLEINTPTGNLIIQMGHAPSIYTLCAGKEIVFEYASGEIDHKLIQEAIVHVTRSKTTIIINQ